MRKDLESAYRAAIALVEKAKEMLPLVEEPADLSSVAQALSKGSGELRQLFAAIKESAENMPPDEQVSVLVEALLALPQEHLALALASLRSQVKPALWPAGVMAA